MGDPQGLSPMGGALAARPRRLMVLGALLSIATLFAQPSLVLADVFSARTWEFHMTPSGEPNTDYCARSGVVDTARNYGQVNAYTNGGGAHDCVGSVNSLPAGWIGVAVEGIKNGASCGWSITYYSSSATDNWQLYATMCTNPAGLQDFTSKSIISAYDGISGYTNAVGPTSPIAQY